jgi:hypothetical protein
LLPPSAKSLVKLNQRQSFAELGLHEVQFCREVIRFVGQDLEITRAAVLIKYLRELVRPLRRLCQEVLLFAELAVLLRSNERIRYLSERTNGVFVFSSAV